MEIRRGDKFTFHSDGGGNYTIYVIDIDYYRELSTKYGIDIYGENGVGNTMFIGDDFFNKNKDKLYKLN